MFLCHINAARLRPSINSVVHSEARPTEGRIVTTKKSIGQAGVTIKAVPLEHFGERLRLTPIHGVDVKLPTELAWRPLTRKTLARRGNW
jgi:hypothetical protein